MTLDVTRMPGPLGDSSVAYPDRVHALTEQLGRAEQSLDYVQETIAELEFDDRGWVSYAARIEAEFTSTGRQRIVDTCRMMAISNPLLKRGLTVRAGYIWGQGVEVTARVPGADGKPDPVLQDEANQVIDAFEKLNAKSFTSSSAREENERALGTDGEQFFALFSDPKTGEVRVRSVPQLQILMIVTNPEDDDDPWFYVREYAVAGMPKEGQPIDAAPQTLKRVIYPALGFDPRQAGLTFRPRVWNGAEVMWDAPMVHVPVNRLDGWQRGIPDVYASMAYARLYNDFLIDWAGLTKALSRIAWKATGETKSRAQLAAAAARTAHKVGPITSSVAGSEAGGTAVMGPGNTFEAVSKSGATIDSESGRPLAAMIAAGIGLPVTLLLADPGVTGARATAQTLDLPTALEMGMRRLLWQSTMEAMYQHAIQVAAMAPGSKLRPLTGDRTPQLDFAWPALDGVDPLKLVQAITMADTTETMPPLTTLRLLLSALGVPNVDEVLTEVTDASGNFLPPKPAAPAPGAGDVATQAFRAGQDPAAAMADNTGASGGQ